MGEIVSEDQGALFRHSDIDRLRVSQLPALTRIVIAIDPAVTANALSDHTGIIVAGLGEDKHGYVIEDASCHRKTPLEWAERALKLYYHYEADAIICESNQGGDLIKTLFKQLDNRLPLKSVWAHKGKRLRAEPIAALYAQGRVHHLGTPSELEDEICSFGVGAGQKAKSPDRMDALVWALSELMVATPSSPQLRHL